MFFFFFSFVDLAEGSSADIAAYMHYAISWFIVHSVLEKARLCWPGRMLGLGLLERQGKARRSTYTLNHTTDYV